MTTQTQLDLSKLILRLTCGGLLILHGTNSLLHGVGHIRGILASNGLPEFFAPLNLVGEFVGPLLVIIGFKTRIGALLIAINMFLSIVIAHRDIAFARNDFGGWMIELNIFYLMTAVVVLLLGGGRFAISRGGAWD